MRLHVRLHPRRLVGHVLVFFNILFRETYMEIFDIMISQYYYVESFPQYVKLWTDFLACNPPPPPRDASISKSINYPLVINHSTHKSRNELPYDEALIYRVHTSHVVPHRLINQSSPLRKGKPLFIKHSTPKSSHELTYGESLIFRVHTSHVVPQAGEGPTCSTDSANYEHKSTKFDNLQHNPKRIPVPTSRIPDPTFYIDLEPDRNPNSNSYLS